MLNNRLAVLGMGVMGKALAENFASRGFPVTVWNLCADVSRKVAEEHTAKYASDPKIGKITVAETIDDLKNLARPRIAVIMITAGDPVDQTTERLKNVLEDGDIIVDAGNSLYLDTVRRCKAFENEKIHFVGMGVSGGEEGALKGPSLMPAAPPNVYDILKPYLEAISAKTDSGPCVARLATDGAGHFVKMVHNGIEYADMQVICEVYHIMRDIYRLDNAQCAQIFGKWSEGKLSSYLIDITAAILAKKSGDDNYIVDEILDQAGQKGTGSWTVRAAAEVAVPIPAIAGAVDARILSSHWKERQNFSRLLPKDAPRHAKPTDEEIDALRDALYAAKLMAYQQGYHLIQAAAEHYGWDLSLKEISRIWKGGCIIRAKLLDDMMRIFDKNPTLKLLLDDEETRQQLQSAIPALRRITLRCIENGIPAPVLSSSLAYFEQWTAARLPHNLLQAQRDFFGAHTYRRLDNPEGPFIHTEWI